MKMDKLAAHPGLFRRLMNLWPPFIGAGISVEYIAPDWREVRTSLKLRFYNRNYMGTHFGGSLFAMADPFLMIMLANLMGPEYRVWDQASSIDFLRPGRGTVRASFVVSEEDLAKIRSGSADGAKHLEEFSLDITDGQGEVVARVRKVIYVRQVQRR